MQRTISHSRYFSVLLVAGLFILLPVLCGASQPAQDTIISEKYVLDNGLTALIAKMPSSPIVSIYMLVKVGSAMEGKYLGSGITHLMEHMLFKGTEIRGVGSIASEVQALGGTINASTGLDHTVFRIDVPADGFKKALAVLSDMIMHAKFDEEELQKEKDVVLREMRMHRDRPHRRLSELVFQTVFLRHPYKLAVIGHEELLLSITREDILEYYHKFYIPNNMIISIAGPINLREVLSSVEEVVNEFKRGHDVLRVLPQEPEQIAKRRLNEEYATDLTRLSLSFRSVSILDEDLFALDVLAMVLGRGKSSRLYKDLFREKGLVHSVHASNYTPMDPGVFEIECLLAHENVDQALDGIWVQIDKIINKGVDAGELKKAKRQVLSEYLYQRQTSSDIAYAMAVDEAFVGDHEFSREYVSAIEQVLNNDIKRVSQKYLVASKASIVVLSPPGLTEKHLSEQEPVKEADIKKVTLKNGLKILLREDHTSKIVAVSLVLNAGTRQEDPDLNGISELTSRLWVQATTKRSSKEIAEEVESRGMHLNGFSGRNSFGIKMELLSDDIDFAVSLLEELVERPSFDNNDFMLHKEKQKSGILVRNDSVFHVAMNGLRKTLFKSHHFRLDTLGTIKSVENIARENVVEFYKKLSAPNNMVISVFGDFDSNEIEKILEAKLGDLKSSDIELITHTESVPEDTREVTRLHDKEQAIVMFGFHAEDFYHEDTYGLNILAAILGSPFQGRLFTRVRDEFGKAYALGGDYLPATDAGMIYFYVLTSNENIARVKHLVADMIEEVKQEVVPDEELANMKAYLKGTFQMGIQTNESLGFRTALDELYGLGYDNYRQYNSSIDNVSKDDLKRLAQEYLNIKNAAILVLSPRGGNVVEK